MPLNVILFPHEYVANNVDHNICAIDGSGTFHGLGIIAARTQGSRSYKAVPRISVTAEEIACAGSINIQYMKPSPAKPLTYQPIQDLEIVDPTSNLD